MNNSTHAPFYDLFKLIVAILLLLIFLCLTFWTPSQPTPQALIPSGTPLPPRSTPTVAPAISSPTVTSTSIPPTATSTPQITPSPTEPTQSPAPTPTETPTPEPTTPPIAENQPGESICQATARTQLKVGMKAIIQHRLNFRSSAGILNNRLLTNPPGTQVDVIGGPACTAYKNGSSYLWWQIKLPNGDIGWSAEASAFGGFYFMEPSP